MKVAVYSRVVEVNHPLEVQLFFDELLKQRIQPIVFAPYLEQIRSFVNIPDDMATFAESADLDDTIDFLVSLGGDGTLLDTITLVRDKNIPVLGINFGRQIGRAHV